MQRRIPSGILLILGLAAAFAIPILAFRAVYPLLGYSSTTVVAIQIAILLAGVALAAFAGYGAGRLGSGLASLAQGVVMIAGCYALFLAVAAGLSAAGVIHEPLLRAGYSPWLMVDNWLLTGFGEELLFRGFLLTLMVAMLPSRYRWWAVVASALVFALWHLPSLVASGREGAQLLLRLALPAASGLIFGAVYLWSRNLWFTAFLHGTTNYPLSPLITENPVLGLAFMAIALGAAFLIGRMGSAPRPGGSYRRAAGRA
jgi:membrane protease YdiL (CAAX protease family)